MSVSDEGYTRMFVCTKLDIYIFINITGSIHSKTCLNRTLLGLTNLFSLDMYLVCTG